MLRLDAAASMGWRIAGSRTPIVEYIHWCCSYVVPVVAACMTTNSSQRPIMCLFHPRQL